MFMLLIYVGAQIFSMFQEGKTGAATTVLTAEISESATTIQVHDTSQFLSANFIIIGDEDICYSAVTATTFLVAVNGRGCNETTAVEHKSGANVYDELPGFLNRAISMQKHDVEADDGIWGTIKGKFSFIGVAASWVSIIPQIVAWDYAYLEGIGVYLKFFLYTLSAGLVLMSFRMLLGR